MPTTSSLPELLRARGLRSTPVRRALLARLREVPGAASAPELERALGSDRVTVYRTLNAFEESGLVHRVHDGSGAEKYALCVGDACGPGGHAHHHAHFRCESCERTECLPGGGRGAEVALPAGYVARERILTYVGRCAACGQNAPA